MKGVRSSRSHNSRLCHTYRSPSLQPLSKPKAVPISSIQDPNQLQHQQTLLAHSSFGMPAGRLEAGAGAVPGVPAGGGGVINMPSYADQMHAAFLDYQRQRLEFEQQQQHLLQKLYHHYPDVSGTRLPGLVSPQAQRQPAEGPQGPQGANGFAYQYPQFVSNGLQSGGLAGPTVGSVPQQRAALGAGDFYSTQQHMGFMQQQHQDVLRDQQQLVAQQFATSQLAPTTRQSFGMAVPMSSVFSGPFQSSPDVSHLSFRSGNPNHSF